MEFGSRDANDVVGNNDLGFRNSPPGNPCRNVGVQVYKTRKGILAVAVKKMKKGEVSKVPAAGIIFLAFLSGIMFALSLKVYFGGNILLGVAFLFITGFATWGALYELLRWNVPLTSGEVGDAERC